MRGERPRAREWVRDIVTSETSREKESTGPKLKCLQGQPPAQELLRRWRRYTELPAQIHGRMWDALTPILLGLPQDEVPHHVAQFAAANNVEPTDLSLALEGCHALLLESTARNLEVNDFDADLRALDGAEGNPVARAALVEGYERAKRLVRQRIVAQSVAEHGKVLTGINWRIDRILSSSHGVDLNTPILLMTLHYEDAGEKGRTVFQVSDENLKMLRDFCDRMLKLGAEAPSEEELAAQEAGETS